MYCRRLLTSIAAFLFLAAGHAFGADSLNRSPFMPINGQATQPIGHYDLCKRLPIECKEHTASTKPVHLTSALWKELIAVNDTVNTTIKPDTDMNIYGVEEYWNYPDSGRGDCEDYVLLKRRDLMQKGWPAGSLLITVVRQTNGDGHAVLTVRTDRGDLILDNLEGRIKLWNETDYQFIKRQANLDSGLWVSIDDDRSVLVGSIKR